MNDQDAVQFMATWGSYMTGGDPGACMYGFSGEGPLVVQDENHRINSIEWLERCKDKVEASPDDFEESDQELEDIDTVVAMLRKAPIEK